AGFDKSDAVQPAHKINDIAAGFAAAAIEKLFFDIDGKPIVTAAFRAWPIAFGLAGYLDVASCELVFDMNRACAINPGLMFDRPHVRSMRKNKAGAATPASSQNAISSSRSLTVLMGPPPWPLPSAIACGALSLKCQPTMWKNGRGFMPN